MSRFIETICYENGVFHRIPLHEERMNQTRCKLLSCKDILPLKQFLQIPENLKNQKVKCKVTYSNEIQSIEYELYMEKVVMSLKLVWDNSIEYDYKYKNRDDINRLFGFRETADEILIVKNGFITDTSFSNIAFCKNGLWFTPEFPLLAGIRRKDYLEKKQIITQIITPDDLSLFDEAKLINSMRSLEGASSIAISSIY